MAGRNTAQIEGDDAATGDYLYHTHDHLPPSPRLRRDWRGSTRQVYDQSKAQAAAFDYTPYGRELLSTNRTLTTRGYTGHTREAALGGAYYAPFRYYHPSLARWEKRDPLGMVDGPNVYAYVRGNVVNHFDAIGLCRRKGEDFLDCVLRRSQNPGFAEHPDGPPQLTVWQNLKEDTHEIVVGVGGSCVAAMVPWKNPPQHVYETIKYPNGSSLTYPKKINEPKPKTPLQSALMGFSYGSSYYLSAKYLRPRVNMYTECAFACDGNSWLGRTWSKMPDWIR